MDEKGIPVLISLDAESSVEGQPEDALRLITTGTLNKRGEEYALCYEETLDEDEPPQKIEVVISGNVITMSRQGSFDTNMIFQKGQRYEGQYKTPVGTLDVALFCTRASFSFNGDAGEIALNYQLDVSGQFAAVHALSIHFIRKRNA